MGNRIDRGIKLTRRFFLADEVAQALGPRGRAVAWVGVATLVNFVGWMGWDQGRGRAPDGSLLDPYERWQFVGLALGLALIAAAAGRRHRPWEATISAAVVILLCFVFAGGMDPRNDALYVLGAFVAAWRTFIFVGLAALVADGLAGDKFPGRAVPGWHRRRWVWVLMTTMIVWDRAWQL